LHYPPSTRLLARTAPHAFQGETLRSQVAGIKLCC